MKGKVLITGMIGLLLWSFLPNIAEADSGGLPECTTNLAVCNTNFGTCTTNLTNAQASLSACQTNLGVCNTNQTNAQANLSTCQANLSTCETNAQVSLLACQTNLATCQANMMEFSLTMPPPSWYKKFSCNSNQDCPRFEITDEWHYNAVLDKETGLVWEREPSDTPMTWASALWHCANLSIRGRLGWRLPTVEELTSLIDPTQTAPALPPGNTFFNVSWSSQYWTATTHVTGASDPRAFSVQYYNEQFGYVHTYWIGQEFLAWCVRGGKGREAF